MPASVGAVPASARLRHGQAPVVTTGGKTDIVVMDAPNPSALPTPANRTPLRIGAYGLLVRDLEQMTAYYSALLRLTVLERGEHLVRLGTPGGVPLLDLEHRADAKPDDERQAGLYHSAFLMPTRVDLARWILHVSKSRIPVSGASDHDVSEAVYLDDPEGNGIEVYADRPRRSLAPRRQGDLPKDRAARHRRHHPRGRSDDRELSGAPDGLRVGHIHLRVGDVEKAEAFYAARSTST